MDLEAFQGVFGISCRKYHEGRILQRADEIQTRQIRHVDVHVQDVRLPHKRSCRGGRRTGGDELQEGNLPDIHAQLADGQRLVIDGHNPDHAPSFSGFTVAGSNRTMSYTSPLWSMLSVY